MRVGVGETHDRGGRGAGRDSAGRGRWQEGGVQRDSQTKNWDRLEKESKTVSWKHVEEMRWIDRKRERVRVTEKGKGGGRGRERRRERESKDVEEERWIASARTRGAVMELAQGGEEESGKQKEGEREKDVWHSGTPRLEQECAARSVRTATRARDAKGIAAPQSIAQAPAPSRNRDSWQRTVDLGNTLQYTATLCSTVQHSAAPLDRDTWSTPEEDAHVVSPCGS